jgi:hypothetical protein
MAVLNDGTVNILVSEAVPRGHEVDFVNGAEAKNWRSWAEGRQTVARDRRALVSGYVETLVLDYLVANTRRNLVTVDVEAAASSIHLLENGGAFPEKPDLSTLDLVLGELRRVSRFRPSLQRLRRSAPADHPAAGRSSTGQAKPPAPDARTPGCSPA